MAHAPACADETTGGIAVSGAAATHGSSFAASPPHPNPLPHHVLRSADGALEDPTSQHVTGERGHLLPGLFVSPPASLSGFADGPAVLGGHALPGGRTCEIGIDGWRIAPVLSAAHSCEPRSLTRIPRGIWPTFFSRRDSNAIMKPVVRSECQGQRERSSPIMTVLLICAAAVWLSAGGCSGPRYLEMRKAPQNPLEGPLSLVSRKGPQPTPRTIQTLRQYNLYEMQEKEPDRVLQELQREIAVEPRADKLHAFAELAYIAAYKADAVGEQRTGLESVRHGGVLCV